MDATGTPRLSEAKTLLPFLRVKLSAASRAHTLPAGVSLRLLPLVENGVFGYEIVPDRPTRTYLTIGWCERGRVVLRRTSCSTGPPSLLRLAAVDGKRVSGVPQRARAPAHQRDTFFTDVSEAADAGFLELASLFPERPRKPVELDVHVHRYLDEALAIAHTHLTDWDPYIQFFGLPNEAQFGFALTGDHGEHGELVSQRPDMWVLRWKTPKGAMYEEWGIVLPAAEANGASAPG